MNETIHTIAIDKLTPHPDNPNRMSRPNFARLVRNIERTGRYEPLVVRPHPRKAGCFQIINGHHRCDALKKLGHPTARAIVWDVNDEQTDILLATLNRLGGRDIFARKLAVLRRLNRRMAARNLSKLVPHTTTQLQRLMHLKPVSPSLASRPDAFAVPMVFFVSAAQQKAIEKALSRADVPTELKTRAAKRAAALVHIADRFVASVESEELGQ